jgi:hypothetical protein
MSDTPKKPKTQVNYLPGCFDNLDITQEELDQFMAELEDMFASESFESLVDSGRVMVVQLPEGEFSDEELAQLLNLGDQETLDFDELFDRAVTKANRPTLH